MGSKRSNKRGIKVEASSRKSGTEKGRACRKKRQVGRAAEDIFFIQTFMATIKKERNGPNGRLGDAIQCNGTIYR